MADDTIARKELAVRIDDFLLHRLDPSVRRFGLRTFVPIPTWNRFDLGFKLLHLDAQRGIASEFAERIYAAHVAAFSLGDMTEPGQPGKTGILRYTEDFRSLLQGMQSTGFDAKRSLVPMANDGSLLNAGHRAACAISLGLPVVGVKTGLEPMIFDHAYFRRRGMSESDLDAGAMRMVAAMPNAAVALLWPAAHGRDHDAEAILGPLVYRKEVSLSMNGAHNLLARVCAGEPWLGDPALNFPGIRRKLMECFSGRDPLRVLIFDAPSRVERMALKENVRQIYEIAKGSIHITDTHSEAVELSRLLLNANSRHFLDHARPMTFAQTRTQVEALRRYLDGHCIPPSAVAADTGMVLGAYGLRAPCDIDVISDRPLPAGPVEQHDGRYRDVSVGDLLQDPAHHFSYFGLTFVSLWDVAALKRRRLAGADRADLLTIEPLLKVRSRQAPDRSIGLRLRIVHLRLRRGVIRFLFRIGIGPALRKIYRAARGRADRAD